MSDLTTLQHTLDITFTDQELLQQVFVHRSYINEHRSFPLGHNERLEFLGDAVLELCVTEFLYKNYPNPEGELTNWRSALVKGEMLAVVATELGFTDHLMLSFGESRSGGRARNQILANAYEAFLGALYLDQGYDICQKFVTKTITYRLDEILKLGSFIDPKSRLQELAQERFGQTPQYEVMSESGPDHAKEFEVRALVGEREVGRGMGSSKQAAQVAAAAHALGSLS
jgi:ribonuclease-3